MYLLFITNTNLLPIYSNLFIYLGSITYCLFVDIYKKYVYIHLLLLLCSNFLWQNVQVQNRIGCCYCFCIIHVLNIKAWSW